MKKVCVIGHFGFGELMLNGQTIKTKIVTNELEKKYGTDEVLKIDTHGGIKALPVIVVKMLKAFIQCDNVVILPAHNGIKVFVPLCALFKRLCCRKVHYIVIGGWLPSFLDNNRLIKFFLKYLDGIYVETHIMQELLIKQGINNTCIMKNFKVITTVKESEMKMIFDEPYCICTFSRVMKEKGIEDIIYAVDAINKKYGREVYNLDIYGQIDSEQEEWFRELIKNTPPYITYKGVIDYNESVQVIKNYFMLVFPTKFYTEGIPGTIIDAYAAGVPVVSSKWESFDDVIEERITGVGYSFDDIGALIEILDYIKDNSGSIINMKKNCLRKADEFSSCTAMRSFLRRL